MKTTSQLGDSHEAFKKLMFTFYEKILFFHFSLLKENKCMKGNSAWMNIELFLLKYTPRHWRQVVPEFFVEKYSIAYDIDSIYLTFKYSEHHAMCWVGL